MTASIQKNSIALAQKCLAAAMDAVFPETRQEALQAAAGYIKDAQDAATAPVASRGTTDQAQTWDIVNIADNENGRIYVEGLASLAAAREEVKTQAAKHPAAVFFIMEAPAPFPGPLSFNDGVLEYVARQDDGEPDPVCHVCYDARCDPYIADPNCGARD